MKTKILSVLLLFFAHVSAQYNSNNLFLASEAASAKFTYGNMRVYPLYAREEFLKSHSVKENYLSLKEALDKKKIRITEKEARGSSAEVNKLFVQNLSNDTVMILGGEVIEGGKQDRMIAEDIILPPHSKNIDLSVYCVEHGRWRTKSSAREANSFKLNDVTLMASPQIRKAGGVNKNQSEVWEKVKVVTDGNGCTSATGNYNSLQTDSTYTNKLTGYRVFFTTILKSDHKIIGAVFASGKRVLGCDIFASHDLFIKHAPGIVNSYSTEAMSNGGKVTIPYSEVKLYSDNLLDEKKQDKLIEENGTMLNGYGKKIHISTYGN